MGWDKTDNRFNQVCVCVCVCGKEESRRGSLERKEEEAESLIRWINHTLPTAGYLLCATCIRNRYVKDKIK